MTWDLQLERASFRGVEFDCQVVDDDLGHRLAEHTYPYRNGADLEDMGRRARRTRLRAVFMNDADRSKGVGYEAKLNAFLEVADEGKTGLFQHPLMGSWQAKCSTFPVHHEHSARDMATMEVEFVEDGTNTSLPDMFSVSQAKADVEEAATLVITENASLLDQAIDGVTDAVNEARDFANSATAMVQSAVDRVNLIRSKINACIAAAKKLTDIQRWPVVQAMRRLVASVQKLGKAVQSLSPPVILHTVGATTSLKLLAHALYGDANRAADLIKLNHVRNPALVPAGVQLRVFGK